MDRSAQAAPLARSAGQHDDLNRLGRLAQRELHMVEAVEFATLEWVDWFNNRRLLEPIGNIPPAEAEAKYYADTEELAMVA